eukprot:2128516-Amphidinium_carterae.1
MDCYWDSRCTDETRVTEAPLQAQRRARKQRLRSSQGAALVSTMDASRHGSAWEGLKSRSGARLAFARVAVETGDSRHSSAENLKIEAGSGSSGLPDVECALQSARSLPLPDADCSSRLTQPLGSREVLNHHSLDGQACVRACVCVRRFAWTLMESQWQDKHQSPSVFVAPEGGRAQGRKTRGAARV